MMFLHDRSWIPRWIKSISNELDIAFPVSCHNCITNCDVISPALHNQLWHLHQKVNRPSWARYRCVFCTSCMASSSHVTFWWRHHDDSNTLYYFWEIKQCITVVMMTSSNGNIFRVTDPLCGKFTGHLWILLTKASDAKLWCFLWSTPE